MIEPSILRWRIGEEHGVLAGEFEARIFPSIREPEPRLVGHAAPTLIRVERVLRFTWSGVTGEGKTAREAADAFRAALVKFYESKGITCDPNHWKAWWRE